MLRFVKTNVLLVESWVLLIFPFEEGWWIVIWLPPQLYLLGTVLLSRLLLAESLEFAIMSLVNPPGLFDFGVVLQIHLIKDQIERLRRPTEFRGKGFVKVVTRVAELFAGYLSLLLTCLVEWNVDPPWESAILVPDGLAVPHEYNFLSFIFLLFVELSKVDGFAEGTDLFHLSVEIHLLNFFLLLG